MKFVSLLKQIGMGALSIAGVVLSPPGQVIMQGTVPSQTAISWVDRIAFAIAAAEVTGETVKTQLASVNLPPGTPTINVATAKAQAVLPTVIAALKTSELVAGRKIVDETRFQASAMAVLNGFVGVLDSIEHPGS